MKTFMKKSSLALLLAVLVLLTGILVGTAVTAAAEEVAEPEYEAALFNVNGAAVTWDPDGDSVKTPIQGTLEEVIKAVYQHSNTANYRLVLYKDVEIEEAGLIIKPIAEFDGQGHTIYIDDSINVEASKNFFNITHAGTTTFKNINFVGQDMDWDGTVANMKTFSTSNNYSGAIQVPAGCKFVMEDCTMTAFRTLGRASCIWVSISGLTEYSNDNGVWLKDTQIVGNYSVGAAAGGTSVAVNVPPSGSGAWGNVLHVSGNTVVKDNYDMNGSAAANIYVLKTTAMTGTESSVLMVEEDFTGTVGMIVNQSINNQAGRRGAVFFAGETYDANGAYTRKGVVFINAGDATDKKIYIQAQGATTNTFQYFIADVVADDTTSPYGFFAITGGLGGNMSTLTDTVKLTVMDKAGTKELFSYETTMKNGDILDLPTWATWTDAKWGLAAITHANGADYVGKVNYDTGFLYSTTAAGTSWTYSADFTPTNAYKIIEALGDYELTATPSTGYNSNLIIDFNGYTLTRADKTYNLKWEGTSSGSATQDITIRNMVFDGTIGGEVPEDANTLIRGYKYATMTLENCDFRNIITVDATSETYSSYAAVIMANATSSITLKDVTATNCKGHQGVVYAGAIPVYLAGDTRIGEVVDGAFVSNTALNCYAVGTSVAVIETFTGECYLSLEGYGTTNQPVYFRSSSVTPTDEMKAKAFVAEGAEIKGRIAPSANPTGYFAYNNGGTLSWTKPGNALPETVVYDAEDNTLSVDAWFYNNGTEDVKTAVVVADQFNYSVKSVDTSAIEAVNANTLAYGNLADLVAAAANNQTIEVLKDVTGINNLTISTAITLDGNGKTLTWRISPDPTAEASNDAYMIKVTVAGALFKDVTLHGGAAEKAVWDGPLAPIGARMFVHVAPTTLQNVVLTGARIEMANRDDGALLGYSSSVLTLIDVTVIDNIVKINDKTAYNAGPHLTRQGSDANPTTMSGKMIFKENYTIKSDGAVYQENFFINSPKRVTIGQLTEGSEIHTYWAGSYTPLLNEAGKPFNNTGYIYSDNASTAMTTVTNDDGSIAISGNSSWRADLAYDGTTMSCVSANKVTLGETVDTQGGITSDKFELYYMPTVTADYYGTDVVVKINGEEVARKNLSEYAVASSVITVEAAVGMAELTDEIVLEFQDAETKEVYATWSTTAKTYANGLMVLENLEAEAKAAVASLLRYGARVQTFFNHNVENLAMTPDEEAAWIEAGYLTGIGEGLTGGDAVKATQDGSVSGITIYGATLTMENQMSLRLYFTADSLDGYTFTVGDQAVEVEEDKARGLYYIEASHIGTASLAEAVNFVIASETETMTYTASPMSYVFAVFGTQNEAITDGLKAACEALYYYFVAAGECFGFDTNIGFTAALQVSVDPVNAYSIPYGITAA